MDQEISIVTTSKVTSFGGKSWTAYIRVAIIGFVLLFLVTPMAWAISMTVGIVALIASLALSVYQIMYIRSFHLYSDETGVWVYSGFLPWNKGVGGVKWRDLDDATFTQSMASWLFKSFSIRIGHRFTKSNEILLSHWSHGDQVVMAINSQHQARVEAGTLN